MSYDTQDTDLEVTDSAPNITTDSNQVGSAEPAWRELKSYDPHCFACGQESSMGAGFGRPPPIGASLRQAPQGRGFS